MKKLSVLLLVPEFCVGGKGKGSPTSEGYEPVAIGGDGLSTLSLAIGLKEKGHDVQVMSAKSPLVEEFLNRNIRFIEAPVDKRSFTGIFRGAYHIRKYIMLNKFRIVHSQTLYPGLMSFLARIGSDTKQIKLIWHCRGIRDKNYPIVGRACNILFDFIIANCNFERDRLIKSGLSSHKIRTIYNCPNIEGAIYIKKDLTLLKELSIKESDLIVGTVSRLAPDRGVEYLLLAARIVVNKIPNIKFLIVGGGPEEAKLRQLVDNLNIRNQVLFLGPRRDVGRIYSILNLYVSPRPLETGTGNSNAEAMAFGKPVVACNSGGVPELVKNGVTGILVPPKDSQAIAEAVLFLLDLRGKSIQMGLAGRERILCYFNRDRLIKEVEEVYEQISSG